MTRNAIVEKFYFDFLCEKVLFEMKFLYQLCSSRKLSGEFGNKNVSQSKIGLFSKLVFEEKLVPYESKRTINNLLD